MPSPHQLQLHHVGFAVKSIADIAETHIRRFGFQPVSPVIHDPLQTALVQFLRFPGNPALLEFVAPDGDRSTLSGAVRKGGGLNHLCYTAGPLEAAIERLRADGMLLIGKPQPGRAFADRRICWLCGSDRSLVELVERRDDHDLCEPGQA